MLCSTEGDSTEGDVVFVIGPYADNWLQSLGGYH